MRWDSPEWREVRNRKLKEWFLGNEDAVSCLIDLSTISETWDDMIDKDVPMTDELICEAFVAAMVILPTNPFFVRHRHLLEPIVIVAINAWMDSEEMVKRGDDKSRMIAFFARNLGQELAPMIAFCVGGFKHMRKVSIEMRDFLNHETYQDWEHRHVA